VHPRWGDDCDSYIRPLTTSPKRPDFVAHCAPLTNRTVEIKNFDDSTLLHDEKSVDSVGMPNWVGESAGRCPEGDRPNRHRTKLSENVLHSIENSIPKERTKALSKFHIAKPLFEMGRIRPRARNGQSRRLNDEPPRANVRWLQESRVPLRLITRNASASHVRKDARVMEIVLAL